MVDSYAEAMRRRLQGEQYRPAVMPPGSGPGAAAADLNFRLAKMKAAQVMAKTTPTGGGTPQSVATPSQGQMAYTQQANRVYGVPGSIQNPAPAGGMPVPVTPEVARTAIALTPQPPVVAQPPVVPQGTDRRFFELNTQMSPPNTDVTAPAVTVPEAPKTDIIDIDKAAAAVEVAREVMNADPTEANVVAYDNAVAAYDNVVANSGVAGFGDIIDAPRAAVVTEMGANAYDVATGKKTDWGAEWAAIAPGNWMIPGLDSTRFTQDFEVWAENPDNWLAIQNASENGFQASETDPRYTGGRAVWELFINSAGTAYKAIADLLLDPTIIAPIGKSLEAPLLESATRTAAEDGNLTAAAIKFATGKLLGAPQTVLDATIDAPLNYVTDSVAGAIARRGTGRWGRFKGQFAEPAETRAASQIDAVDETLITYEGLPRDGAGPGPGAAPTPDGGAPIPPTEPSNRYRMNQEGDQWVIYDPAGQPTGETFPYTPRTGADRNVEERVAIRRLNELNKPLQRADELEMGAILPAEDAGLTWTDPSYDRITLRGQDMPMTVQARVAYGGSLDPGLRRQWMDAWTPKAREHEAIMNDIRVRETQDAVRQGISIENLTVQQRKEFTSPLKTYETVRFLAEDTLAPFKRTFPSEPAPAYRWITGPELDPKNVNNLIEHAVFGAREDAIQARKLLRVQNVNVEGFRAPRDFVERLAQMGETLNGSGWRSTDPTAVKSRLIRQKQAAAAPDVEAAMGDLGLPKRPAQAADDDLPPVIGTWESITRTNVPSGQGSPLPKQPPDVVKETMDATSTPPDMPTPTSVLDAPQPPKPKGKRPTATIDPNADDRTLVKNLTESGVRWTSPGKNKLERGQAGIIRVEKPGRAATNAERVRIVPVQTKDGTIWDVGTVEAYKTQVSLAMLGDAIMLADELIARAKLGIEPTQQQVERVIVALAEANAIDPETYLEALPAPTRFGMTRTTIVGPERPITPQPKVRKKPVQRPMSTFFPSGKNDKEIISELSDQSVRHRTASGLRIEKSGATSISVRPVEAKSVVATATVYQGNAGTSTWKASINLDVGAQPAPKSFPTLADAIAYADGEIVSLVSSRRSGVGVIPASVQRNLELESGIREAILRKSGALEGPGGEAVDLISRGDTSHVGAAHRMGVIPDDTYATLSRWVDYDGERMRLWEAYDRALYNAPGTMDATEQQRWARRQVAEQTVDPMTRAELTAAEIRAAERGKTGRTLNKALVGYQTWLKFLRESIMFNWARGWSSAIADIVGNAYTLAINNEYGAALKGALDARSAKHFIQDERGKQLVLDNLPGVERYKKITGKELPTSVTHLKETRFETGDTELVLQKTGKLYPLLRPIADKDIAAFRTGMDRNNRFALHMSAFDRFIAQEQTRFRGIVATRAERTGNSPADWLQKLDDLGDDYNGKDVYDAFGDTRLATDWAGMANRARTNAKTRVDNLLFTYKQLSADNKLRNFIFFHYWMSRAAILHSRTALKNPWLINAYARAWGAMEREAEQNGYPPNVRGFIRLMGSESGMYGLINPVNVLVPFSILIENNGDEGTFAFLQRWGLFINPLIEAAAASLGWTDGVPDITGTRQVRRAARATTNWLNSNGFDKLVPNTLGDPNTWQGSIVDEAEFRIYDGINSAAQRAANALAPSQQIISDYEGASPNAYEQDVLRSIAITRLEETYGPFETWAPDSPVWDELQQTIDDIAMGRDGNPLADAVVEQYADDRLQGIAWNGILPGGLYQRYGPRDQTLAEARAGEDQAWDQRDVAISGNPPLTIGLAQLDRLGTENGRQGYKLWNEIRYEEMDPYGESIQIGGQVFYGWQVNAMNDTQREALADAWLAQYEGVPAEVDEYKGLRTEFLAAHPEVGDFKEYQKGVGNYDGGIKAWRTQYAKQDPAFAQAMKAEGERQRGYGKTGAVLDAELDQWAMTPEAYNVANGYQNEIYDAPATPKVPAYGFGGDAAGAAPKSSGPKDPMDQVRDTITTYQTKVADGIAAMKAAGYAVTEQDVYSSNPYYRSIFEQYGIPTMSDDVWLYQGWVAMQPPGANTSVDSYIQYLKLLGQRAA